MAYQTMLHEADYDDAIRQRNMAYADYLCRYPRMQSMAQVKLKPYRDEYTDLSSDPYAGDRSSDDEDRRHVADDSVRAYVNKLLFNAALDVNEEHMYDQDAEEDTQILYPEWIRRSVVSSGGDDDAFVRSSFESEPGISYNRTPRRNQNKGLKKRRRRKSAEDKEAEKFPFCISGHQDGHPLFTASVYHLREYIESEVGSKVRNIHQYYEDQFKTVNKERMSALAQLIKVKETCYDLQKRLEQAESHLQQYKSLCDSLASQVQTGKAARRRRRLAKKHHKTDPSTVDRNGDGDKNDNPAKSDNRNENDYSGH